MSLLRLKPYKYKNPNKFIIKKNKFIRDFDKLYRQISDPWSQKKNFEYSEQFIFCISGVLNQINKTKKKNISSRCWRWFWSIKKVFK